MKLSATEELRIPVTDLAKDHEWEIGRAKLTLYHQVSTKDWVGIVRQPGKQDLRFRDPDRDTIIVEMEGETSKPPPKIVGYKGASDRFLFIYPGGFTNPAFEAGERGGKLEAGSILRPILDDGLPTQAALDLLRAARRCLDRGGQSPLHMTESSDLDAVWRGPGASQYVQAIRAWAGGDRQEAFKLMHRACEGGRTSWPMFTLYPALLSPNADAILRPAAVRTFSAAVQSVFLQRYDSDPSVVVYRAYLELLDEVASKLAALKPRDYIDLASFVWVSTSYSGDTAPRY